MSTFARNMRLAAYQSISAYGAVASTDPHGLVLTMMDAVIERLHTARACVQRTDSVRAAQLLHSSVILLAELRGSLDLEKGRPLAQNLSDLYDYIMRRLIHANLNSDAGAVAESLALLGEIRGAWAAIGPQVRQAPAANGTSPRGAQAAAVSAA